MRFPIIYGLLTFLLISPLFVPFFLSTHGMTPGEPRLFIDVKAEIIDIQVLNLNPLGYPNGTFYFLKIEGDYNEEPRSLSDGEEIFGFINRGDPEYISIGDMIICNLQTDNLQTNKDPWPMSNIRIINDDSDNTVLKILQENQCIFIPFFTAILIGVAIFCFFSIRYVYKKIKFSKKDDLELKKPR